MRAPLILLAGGRGERAGAPKGLLRSGDAYWLERQIDAFALLGGRRVVVVLGHASAEYFAAMSWLPSTPGTSIEYRGVDLCVALNAAPERGAFSSLQTGLRVALEKHPEADAFFVIPIDVPLPEAKTWRWMEQSAADGRGLAAIVPMFEGRGGHPVWLARSFGTSLLNRPATARLDEEIRALPPDSLARVETADPSVRLNFNSPEDWRRMQAPEAVEVIGSQAALLSAVEVGLGSALHALHVPFRGQILSLNQIFLLSRTLCLGRDTESARTLPFAVSNVAALLKSLSPAGKKLGPMAAISVQGFLFSLGSLALGANLAGALVGAMLASVWSFAQPLLTYFLLFGTSLVSMAEFYLQRVRENYPVTNEALIQFVVVVLSVKLALALTVTVLAYRLPETLVSRYFSGLLAMGASRRRRILDAQTKVPMADGPPGIGARVRGALRDMMNPLFLISLALMTGFVWFADSAHAPSVWILLRPVALGFVFFFAARVFPIERLATSLERRGRFPRFVRALRVALEALRRL